MLNGIKMVFSILPSFFPKHENFARFGDMFCFIRKIVPQVRFEDGNKEARVFHVILVTDIKEGSKILARLDPTTFDFIFVIPINQFV